MRTDTGKSQLMEALHASTKVFSDAEAPSARTKAALSTALADKLVGAFRPDRLGRLTNRAVGRRRTSVTVKCAGIGNPLNFSFATNTSTAVTINQHPTRALQDEPVYLPTRELLPIYPCFLAPTRTARSSSKRPGGTPSRCSASRRCGARDESARQTPDRHPRRRLDGQRAARCPAGSVTQGQHRDR
ncbi:hypothetical protein GGG17_14290 [Arsenicicoccus sp. MKL-02]|uniref:Uncharacterized protein n=1 Tax=Arsenicicoccus cauae TaxID=2663847 RepID=A0A6I3IT71_9MICO|nr:hypothetical protein [Arsenicicoccus cauae]MTB73110.1 hypothetical protein [Arsenicicoccus cauae]